MLVWSMSAMDNVGEYLFCGVMCVGIVIVCVDVLVICSVIFKLCTGSKDKVQKKTNNIVRSKKRIRDSKNRHSWKKANYFENINNGNRKRKVNNTELNSDKDVDEELIKTEEVGIKKENIYSEGKKSLNVVIDDIEAYEQIIDHMIQDTEVNEEKMKCFYCGENIKRNSEYTVLFCFENCKVYFQSLCLEKHLKLINATNDYSVLQQSCLNPNCRGLVKKILWMDKFGNITREILSDELPESETPKNTRDQDLLEVTYPKIPKTVSNKIASNTYKNDKILQNEPDSGNSDTSSCISDMDEQLLVNFKSLCWSCSETEGSLFKCGGCGRARYCSRNCIEADWPVHGIYCVKVQDKRSKKKKRKFV